VSEIEDRIRAFNWALPKPEKEWAGATKREKEQFTVGPSELAKFYGPEQAIGICLIVCAVLLLWQVSRRLREDRVAINSHPNLTRLETGSITPEKAQQMARTVEADLGDALVKRTRCDRWRVQAYPYLAYKMLTGFARTREFACVETIQEQEIHAVGSFYNTRLALVDYAVWAAPTLKFLATIRGMSEGLAHANNPEEMTSVVAFIGMSFQATIVALQILLPLMLLVRFFHRRLDHLRLELQDASDGLFCRLSLHESPPPSEQQESEHVTKGAASIRGVEIDRPIPAALNGAAASHVNGVVDHAYGQVAAPTDVAPKNKHQSVRATLSRAYRFACSYAAVWATYLRLGLVSLAYYSRVWMAVAARACLNFCRTSLSVAGYWLEAIGTRLRRWSGFEPATPDSAAPPPTEAQPAMDTKVVESTGSVQENTAEIHTEMSNAKLS
jgi:hypothetical protein